MIAMQKFSVLLSVLLLTSSLSTVYSDEFGFEGVPEKANDDSLLTRDLLEGHDLPDVTDDNTNTLDHLFKKHPLGVFPPYRPPCRPPPPSSTTRPTSSWFPSSDTSSTWTYPPTTTTSRPTYTASVPSTTFSPSTTESPTSTTGKPYPPVRPVDCSTGEIYFAHQECDKFYMCTSRTSYVVKNCPRPTVWVQTYLTCAHQYQADREECAHWKWN